VATAALDGHRLRELPMRKVVAACALLATLALPFAAPQSATAQRPDPNKPVGENLQVPPDWTVRTDKPGEVSIGSDADSADIFFVSMTPGWHITTGPAAIFYHPGSTAEGDWRAESTIHLFDPGEGKEAFGIFFGGRDLDGAAVAYEYFLIRNTGEFLIKRRRGEETETLKDWTASPALVRYNDPEKSSVKNLLAVEVTADEARFEINGETVASLPRGNFETDGVVGLRVNHKLNLHVSDLTVSER
jgi:hypothetical protein